MTTPSPGPPGTGTQGPVGIPEDDNVNLAADQATLESAWGKLRARYTVHNLQQLRDTGKALQSVSSLMRSSR